MEGGRWDGVREMGGGREGDGKEGGSEGDGKE